MSARSIAEAVRHLAGTNGVDSIFVFDAEVESVNIGNRTCDCITLSGKSENKIPGVRLVTSVEDGILKIPTVGSIVTIILTTFTEPFVVCYGEIDSIILRGGNLGGMVKVITLTQKLNNIENLLKDLITKFNTHTHNVTAVGSPTGPSLLQETGMILKTLQAEIENLNITQG